MPSMPPTGAPFRLAPDGTTDLDEYLVHFEHAQWVEQTNQGYVDWFGLERSSPVSFDQPQLYTKVVFLGSGGGTETEIYLAELKGRKRKAHVPQWNCRN